MEVELTLIAGSVALLLLLLAGFASRRRGIGGWSLPPWDYLMILAAAVLVACLAHLAILWRDGAL